MEWYPFMMHSFGEVDDREKNEDMNMNEENPENQQEMDLSLEEIQQRNGMMVLNMITTNEKNRSINPMSWILWTM